MERFFTRLFHRYGWVTPAKLELEVERLLSSSHQLHEKLMASIDQLTQDIADESTLEDSIVALLTTIKKQLDDALAGTTLPAAVQAKVDAAFAQLEQNKAKLTAAVTANTPAANVPPTASGTP